MPLYGNAAALIRANLEQFIAGGRRTVMQNLFQPIVATVAIQREQVAISEVQPTANHHR
jgi:hypothetical protein